MDHVVLTGKYKLKRLELMPFSARNFIHDTGQTQTISTSIPKLQDRKTTDILLLH